MNNISGFCSFKEDYTKDKEGWIKVLEQMGSSFKFDNSPYNSSTLPYMLSPHVCMTNKLSIESYSISLYGELYNAQELKSELLSRGCSFTHESNEEIILLGFISEGPDFIKKLNGAFSIVIWNNHKKELMFFRDPLGLKPLFYSILNNRLIFSSKVTGLFQYPGLDPTLNNESLCELFALGPARTPGNAIFKDIYEVKPGYYCLFKDSGFHTNKYWQLQSFVHEDTYEQTTEKVSYLLNDAVSKQITTDLPVCTFLSGGLDSSLISALSSNILKKKGEILDTYSFDFSGNACHFKSNAFQPTQDNPYINIMKDYIASNHRYLECHSNDLIEGLYDTVDGRGFPNMADIESSLLYFCRKVYPNHKVALTGECADEIFGGYPWFHDTNNSPHHSFPWSTNTFPRKVLLSDDLLSILPIDDYIEHSYKQSVKETPLLKGENALEDNHRIMAYLNMKWFMATLIGRMESTSSQARITSRAPFADIRIVEYLWNVPWEMKYPNKTTKGLLIDSFPDLIPKEILYRKKSPYPKTYNPKYEELLKNKLLLLLEDSNSPISDLIDKKKSHEFFEGSYDSSKPWFGQLMASPQLLAYILQINYWLEKYNVRIEL